MTANNFNRNSGAMGSRALCWSPFKSIKFFVFCHGLLQLAQLLVSGYLKSSISTIERRYGFSSQKSGLLAAFNEVGNTVLIMFVSFFGGRVHRPRFIGGGALLASLASLLMALPHFLTGPYEFTNHIIFTSENNSGLCLLENTFTALTSNKSCTKQDGHGEQWIYPLLLLGQLLLGIGTIPIQPFGISYIDDFASKRNSPLYLGLLLAATSIGPAFGFIMGSFVLRFYVDMDKMSEDQIKLQSTDLRWVGAWWLGFLVASCFLFLTSLPYWFFPRAMPKEDDVSDNEPRTEKQQQTDPIQEVNIIQFLRSFPHIALRTLRSPVYLLVVLAQVFMAALVAGIATFMAKFIEQQFSQTISFSTMIIGSVNIPLGVLGIVLGGVLMRRMSLSVSGASKMCTLAILLCMVTSLPLLLIGCSTQKVAGVYHHSKDSLPCNASCMCSEEAFNPVCGSDGVEFRSPCHAGCIAKEMDNISHNVINYTKCQCVGDSRGESGPPGYALPGTCSSGCSHLLLPFVVLSALTCFIAAFSQTPSYMMILRTVPPEDKSFAVGVQYMLFRVLAFMPAPVLYGIAIDSTCILWGRKCGRRTSCRYYNLDLFRQRFLGLQVLFVCGAVLCFLFSVLVLRKQARSPEQVIGRGRGYKLVTGERSPDSAPSKERQSIMT
ncbi:solute carrier organic anion transporter family member 2B1 [Lampris incognitus]|uniref:solute carrier organic anion transporter family member 2B1 n=1 Tax=Lampris incognitus TaxID=2546036 RepID=UPI0024B57D32|nr:solute carrier organic anion transporter family member 2B1 [Lampris incognitus]